MYSMKEACELTDMTYENLKFYCNEGLVPNVKRDKRNYRVFDEHDIKWIQSLNCLKNCGMSIAEMILTDSLINTDYQKESRIWCHTTFPWVDLSDTPSSLNPNFA